MKYLTSKDLSEKWNISQRRIVCLAAAGKIEGAKLYGKSWMFPEDTKKPKDGRTKLGKAEMQEKDTFRYPIFEFIDPASFNPSLTKEELKIKKCIEAFNAFRFQDADSVLGDLPEKAKDRYIRITALYCKCMLCIFLYDTMRFLDYYEKLKFELTEDFPHKEEMSEYLHEIDSTLGEDEYYANEFNRKSAYCYHESFLPRLCNLSAIRLALGNTQFSQADLMAYETNCIFLENTVYVFDLQALHIYLACAYHVLGRNQERNYHFRKALKLAEQYDMFYSFATMQFYCSRKSMEEALADFPNDFKDRIKKNNKIFYQAHVKLTEALKLNTLYKLLSGNDYVYISLAVQGLGNKEVSNRLHVSAGTVGKRYSEIYSKFGVRSKSELVKLYHTLTDKSLNGGI